MGSKNLKAIAVTVSRSDGPTLHDRAGFLKIVKEHSRALRAHFRNQKLRKVGTTYMTTIMHELGIFPVRNFREGFLPGIENLSSEAFFRLKVGDYGCYSCGTRCGNVFRVAEGPYKGAESEGPEYETVFSFGGEICNTEIGSIVAADALCDRYGIDTISMGGVVGFIMELYEKGIIDSKDIDGLKPVWGHYGVLLELIEMVAKRKGIGNTLAEGTRIAGEAIGRGSEYYAMHAKGLELPGYEPRAAKAHGLGYATSNIGGSHMYGYVRQEISGSTEPRAVERFADEGKGDIAGWNQIKKAIEETGILCNLADSLITSHILADLFVSATGRDDLGDLERLNEVGERIVCLERCFNVREGLGRKDDTLPARMLTEPLQNAGPATGEVIRKMETLVDEYYHYMGYDDNGVPKEEKLGQLRLENAVADMDKYRD
jgi:aldehyde:ferredoxin oxidoreductase